MRTEPEPKDCQWVHYVHINEVGHRQKSDVVQHLSRKKHLDNAALEYKHKK